MEQELSIATVLRSGNVAKPINVKFVGKKNVGVRSLSSSIQSTIKSLLSFAESKDLDLNKLIKYSTGDIANSDANGNCLVFCVYDICQTDSFTYAVSKLKKPSLKEKYVLVGNKCDLEYWRRVSLGEGVAASQPTGTSFMEVSTHTGLHIDFLIDHILESVFGGRLTMLSKRIETNEKTRSSRIG